MDEQLDNIDFNDPLDWRDTAVPQLEAVELSLKCQICKEFYSAPVQTSTCGHTFCSLCIRRFLANQAGGNRHCPVCRERVEESGLRKNIQVEEIVSNYKKARQPMLSAAINALPPDKRSDSLSFNNTTDAQVQCEITARSDPIIPLASLPPGAVICPICSSVIPDKSINEHLDTVCLGNGANKDAGHSTTTIRSSPILVSSRSTPPPTIRTRSTTRQQPNETLTRIPKPFYQAIKTPALKKKLQTEGLGFLSHKPRPELEIIYSEWVLQWNANVDRAKPLSRNSLIKEFRESLNRLMSPSDQSSYRHHNNYNNNNNNIMNKDNNDDDRPEFDSQKWMQQNAETYSNLADQARRSITKRKASSQDTTKVDNTRASFAQGGVETISTSTTADDIEIVCSSSDGENLPNGGISPSTTQDSESKRIRINPNSN